MNNSIWHVVWYLFTLRWIFFFPLEILWLLATIIFFFLFFFVWDKFIAKLILSISSNQLYWPGKHLYVLSNCSKQFLLPLLALLQKVQPQMETISFHLRPVHFWLELLFSLWFWDIHTNGLVLPGIPYLGWVFFCFIISLGTNYLFTT